MQRLESTKEKTKRKIEFKTKGINKDALLSLSHHFANSFLVIIEMGFDTGLTATNRKKNDQIQYKQSEFDLHGLT